MNDLVAVEEYYADQYHHNRKLAQLDEQATNHRHRIHRLECAVADYHELFTEILERLRTLEGADKGAES